ncbi:hypothetical protein, partial [Pantoea sp. Taur]|uniref:hypothetical protein n=1 Tax=Pantoea sp. Taur TaxID=2576757 RepID=UPI0013557D5E
YGNHISGSIAINDEGGTQLTMQEFEEHYLDDVVNNVIYPVTGSGNKFLSCLMQLLIFVGNSYCFIIKR